MEWSDTDGLNGDNLCTAGIDCEGFDGKNLDSKIHYGESLHVGGFIGYSLYSGLGLVMILVASVLV